MISLGNLDRGMQLLNDALALKAIDDHDVIADAIQDRGEGYTVFCIVSYPLPQPSSYECTEPHACIYIACWNSVPSQ